MKLEQLNNDIKQAMRDKDSTKLSTLRLLKNAVQVESKKEGTPEDEVLIIPIIRRELKKRHESAEAYKEAQRPEAFVEVLKEVAVLESYLPKQMTGGEVALLVQHSIKVAGPGAKMGAIMKIATPLAEGRVDGKTLSTAVTAALQSTSS